MFDPTLMRAARWQRSRDIARTADDPGRRVGILSTPRRSHYTANGGAAAPMHGVT